MDNTHRFFFCGGVLKFYSSSYLSNAGWEEVRMRVPRVLLATPPLPQTECYIIWNQGFSFHIIVAGCSFRYGMAVVGGGRRRRVLGSYPSLDSVIVLFFLSFLFSFFKVGPFHFGITLAVF